MLDLSVWALMGRVAGYYPPSPTGEPSPFPDQAVAHSRWILFLLPGLGGLLGGALVHWFAPEAAGHGTDAAIDAYHRHNGSMRARVPLVKAIASSLTIGSGGSAGREGPIAQIGAGVGATLGRWLKLGPADRRVLMAAGLAAGVSAIFRAPMAGSLFAAEVMYRDLDLEYEVIIPSVVASIVAYSVFAMVFGWDPIFATPAFAFRHPAQLAPFTLLGVAVAFAAIGFIKVFYAVHGFFDRLRVSPALKPALGGLATGLVGLFVPQALGTSFGVLQKAIGLTHESAGTLGVAAVGGLLALAAGKALTTSFSVGSGGSGGVFGPAVVIGGALGGATGLAASILLPGLALQPGAFVLVGMASFFAAAANTPISTIIIVSEMTGNYHLLAPSMWTCMIAYLIARRHSLYHKQVVSRFDSVVHSGGMLDRVLKNITVGEALRTNMKRREVETIRPDSPIREVLDRFETSEHTCFPVVTEGGALVGLVRGRNLRSLLSCDGPLELLLHASDIAVPPITVTEKDTLLSCIKQMARHNEEEVIVVRSGNGARVLAMLSDADVLAACQRRLQSSTGTPGLE